MQYLLVTLSISFSLNATLPLTLKMIAADSVIDNLLLKEQNKQQVQHTLEQLPDLHDTLKERIM